MKRRKTGKKNTKSTMKRRKRTKMSYMWCWVQWLAEHTLKSAIHQFTKLGRQTTRDPKEGANILWSSSFYLESTLLEKNNTMKRRKRATVSYIWFLVHWCKYIFTKFGWLTGRDPSKGIKIILNLHFLSRRWVLRKNQGAL